VEVAVLLLLARRVKILAPAQAVMEQRPPLVALALHTPEAEVVVQTLQRHLVVQAAVVLVVRHLLGMAPLEPLILAAVVVVVQAAGQTAATALQAAPA